MAGIRTASTWIRVSLVAIFLALILFVIAFATVVWFAVEWVQNDPRRPDWDYWSIGLWQDYVCPRQYNRDCYDTPPSFQAVWFRASQAMECLGLILMVIAIIILLLYTCSNSFKRRSYLIGTIVCTLLSVAFIVIGLVILIIQFELKFFDVGWSAGLAIAAAVCEFISGVMCLLELCSR